MEQLATNLLALERHDEAAEIGEFVSQNVRFAGNYDTWTPAARTIAVGARAARLLGETERADNIYLPIGEHPDYVINRPLEEQMLGEMSHGVKQKQFSMVTQHNIVRLEDARAGRAPNGIRLQRWRAFLVRRS